MLFVDGFQMVLPKLNSSLGEVGSEEQTYFPSHHLAFIKDLLSTYMALAKLLKPPQYREDGVIRLLNVKLEVKGKPVSVHGGNRQSLPNFHMGSAQMV